MMIAAGWEDKNKGKIDLDDQDKIQGSQRKDEESKELAGEQTC